MEVPFCPRKKMPEVIGFTGFFCVTPSHVELFHLTKLRLFPELKGEARDLEDGGSLFQIWGEFLGGFFFKG